MPSFIKTQNWKLINYFDVWGNAKDGWEINNLCQEGKPFELSEDVTKADILRILKDRGFLKKHVRTNMIHFSVWEESMIEIEQKRDYRPICRLDREWIRTE